jgi:hypothetical protein
MEYQYPRLTKMEARKKVQRLWRPTFMRPEPVSQSIYG